MESREFKYLGHIFDSEQRSIFIEAVHQRPLGKEIIAKQFAQQICSGSPGNATISSWAEIKN